MVSIGCWKQRAERAQKFNKTQIVKASSWLLSLPFCHHQDSRRYPRRADHYYYSTAFCDNWSATQHTEEKRRTFRCTHPRSNSRLVHRKAPGNPRGIWCVRTNCRRTECALRRYLLESQWRLERNDPRSTCAPSLRYIFHRRVDQVVASRLNSNGHSRTHYPAPK